MRRFLAVAIPVIGATGIVAQSYTFEVASVKPASFAAEPSPDSDAPSLFTAIQEELGLKLESTRGPVEVLVIDRVERPTPD